MQPIAAKETLREEIGVYRLAEEIGRGNAAVVYRATDTLYDREVALKVLHPYFAHYLAYVRHFVTEGREGMRLRHPNIVPVFDAGLDDGVAYIAQELVSGGTLADVIQARGGPFSMDETIAVVEQAAAALDHAHYHGCLHRNLKPSNLFFAEHGRIQVADFGALLSPGGAPPANYPVGSPAFMAPEQARGDAGIDQRADIYSLGVVAFLMLTGRAPFEAENPLVLLRKIIDESPPLLERLLPEIDPGVAQAVSQVLAKRPSARYLTASAFAQALAHGQPVTPRREITPTAEPALSPSVASATLPSTGARARPTLAVAPTMTFTRQTVMLAGTLVVTLLLLLAIMAASIAPGIFRRMAGRTTPVGDWALLPRAETLAPPVPTRITPVAARVANPGVDANQNLITNQPATLPPPTVRVLPTPLPTQTIPPTLPATATATKAPTATPGEQLADTPAETTANETAAGAIANAPPPAPPSPDGGLTPGGRIAYTVRNLKTDKLDTVIYNVSTGVSWPVLAAKRQPDFNNQSDLALNSEGGGVDALVLMRPTGELITIASAFSEDSHPHWSPNNRAIVFDSALVGDGRYRLYLQRDTDYGQKVNPIRYDAWELFGRYPVFLLDGRIAYNGCNVWENASICGVYLYDLMGGAPKMLTDWPGDIPTDNLSNQVLVMSDRDGDWNIYLVNPQSGSARPLTTSRGQDGLATASPDANFIAFASDRDGKWGIYVMRTDGSDQRKLFDLDGGYGQGDRDWRQERISWGR
jgi:hypothetical protein